MITSRNRRSDGWQSSTNSGHRFMPRTEAKISRTSISASRISPKSLSYGITTLRARKSWANSVSRVARKMAESDPLTDLVNRSYFARALEEEIEHVTRDGVESAVYFIDLDKFKQVNDTYGHAAGDELLIRLAELLKSRVREKDVVSRLGGDEFTVLARNISREDAMELAGSFNKVLRDTRVAEGEHTFSINCR